MILPTKGLSSTNLILRRIKSKRQLVTTSSWRAILKKRKRKKRKLARNPKEARAVPKPDEESKDIRSDYIRATQTD